MNRDAFIIITSQCTIYCSPEQSCTSSFFTSIKLKTAQCIHLLAHVCSLEEKKERENGCQENCYWTFSWSFFSLRSKKIIDGSMMGCCGSSAVYTTEQVYYWKKNANLMGLPIWLDITYKTQAEHQAIVFSPGKLISWFSYYNSSFQVSWANAIRPVQWNVSRGANPSVILDISLKTEKPSLAY